LPEKVSCSCGDDDEKTRKKEWDKGKGKVGKGKNFAEEIQESRGLPKRGKKAPSPHPLFYAGKKKRIPKKRRLTPDSTC